MAAAGSIKVGNAYILITPEMNQAQLKAQLEIAEKEIAAFSGSQQKLAQQTAKLQEKLQTYLTARYGEEAAKRLKLEQAAAAKREEYAKSETAAYMRAVSTTSEAFAKAEQAKTVAREKAARAQERIALNARNLEVSYGRETAASYLKSVEAMKASGKTMYLTRINEAKQWAAASAVEERKVAAEALKLDQARRAQVKSLSALVIRQAQLEAAEAVKAARTAQAAHTSAYNTRKAEVLATMNGLKAQSIAQTQAALAAAQAAKRSAQTTIKENGRAIQALQDNAKKTEKSWTRSTYRMGQNLNSFGASVSEFGRTVNRSMVTPLLAAASAMSYLGVKAADSIMQSQSALEKMGVTPKDASRQLNTLKDYGTQTPYTVEDMFQYGTLYTRAAQSHGFSSKKATKRSTDLVMSIGDLAAYSGITDPEMVKRAYQAVATIQEADRSSLRNVKSLAQNAGLTIQELASLLGFKDREFTAAEVARNERMKKRKGANWKSPTKSTAASQMMAWMQDAKSTGGIPGESIVDAILFKGRQIGTGTDDAPAKRLGTATISARLANMFEQTKYGLSDMFIQQDRKTGEYRYARAGAALMGTRTPIYKKDKGGDYKLDKDGNRIVDHYEYKGGLLNTLSDIGSGLKGPSSKVIAELFENLTTLGGWVKGAVKVLKEHPGITDAVVEVSKWAALVGVASIAMGALIKTLGLLTKVFAPVVGLGKGLFKAGRGASKIIGQATGFGTRTDADREARSIREDAQRRAREIRQEARRRSDPRERAEGRRQAREVVAEGRRQAREVREQGQADTSFRERYQQRRTNANGGDSRSAGRRAWDGIRGQNSQVEEIEVDTDKAKQRINELEAEIDGLRAKIRNFKNENFNELAEELAGADSSVKAAAERAAKAIRAADTATTNLKGLKLGALEAEFSDVAERTSSLRSQVKRADTAVSKLNDRGLGDLDGELSDAKGKSKALDSALKAAARQAAHLNDRPLGAVRGQLNNVKDAADEARSKIGGGKSSLNSRVGQLNELKTTSVTKQINKLKDALGEAGGKAATLNSRLNNISSHAPGQGGGKGKKGKNKGSSTALALGGVLPGYTPGRDVHVFTSPTAGEELHLSGGESVMRPEWTAAVGADEVTRLNSIARSRGVAGVRQAMHFADGGVLGKLGLEPLVEASRSFNVGNDARGAIATMVMDGTTPALGGDVQKGIIGSGTDGSHFVGSDFAKKFKGMFDFMTEGSWDMLKKAKIPSGWGQIIGAIGGTLAPITGEYFWNDVWKGEGNILERGGTYLKDLFSAKTLGKIVKNALGGIWDSASSLYEGVKGFFSDPTEFVTGAIEGVWELTKGQYNGLVDMVQSLREVWQAPLGYAGQVVSDVYSTAKESLPNLEGLFDFSGDGLTSSKPEVDGVVASQISSPGAGNSVTRWAPQVRLVLAQLGLPMSDLNLVLHRIGVESGGNPRAINLWDSNAQAGYPSQGLLQTIPQTFAAYAGPYRSRGITDPLASIYAGLNYATHRYGRNWRKALSGIKGYATGTGSRGATPGWAWVGEEGPELVDFSGGETVLTHEDSVMSAGSVRRGYAAGTNKGGRTSGIAAEAEKGVSQLNSAVTKLYAIVKQAFTSNRIGSGTANSLNKWLDKENKALQELVKDRTKLATKLKDANAKLNEVKSKESEMAKSISDKATQERSLTSLFNSEGVSVSSAISGLKSRLADIKSFTSNIAKLGDRGFSDDIIAEIADAGPVEGGAMAKELLTATKVQVREFTSAYKAIGSASTSLGKSVAKSYYAAGKEAAQSLVDGLGAKDKKLIKSIEKIAATIVSTLRKKLKVTSKTPVSSSLASLLTWLTGDGQAVKGGGSTGTKKKTTRTTTTYSTDGKGRRVVTVTTTTNDPAKGTSTTVTKRTVGGKTTTSTRVSRIKGYATGTRSAARGIALVGERGPELVDFKGGERVYTARETASMAGGPRYEIHVHEAKSENTTQSVLRAMQYAEVMAGM
ncbi:transglycosylase SLT domain-containing protein [Streptomyces typhae]|nr:transglycosylase SLT domain-containing protein [Streptomyces typhae]